MLVDGPRELIVQFPRNDEHQTSPHGYDTWDDDEERFCFWPYQWADDLVDDEDVVNRFFDLLDLNGAIDQKTNIANA